MAQEIIGRAGHSVSRGVAASHQKKEGFSNKRLSCWDLVVPIGVRLKQKVEDRIPTVICLSYTFLAARLDLMDPFCALLAARKLSSAVCSPGERFLTDLNLAYPGTTFSASDGGKLRAILFRIEKCLVSHM